MITSQGLAREPGASRFILALFPFRCLFESLRNNGSDVPKLYPPIARSNRACVTAPWAWDAAEVCRLRSERHRLLRPAAPLGNPSVRYSAPVRLRATLSGPGSHGRDLQRPQIRPKDFNDRLKLRSAATARRSTTTSRMGIRSCLLAQTDASNHRPEPGRASQFYPWKHFPIQE